jgi:hypothetical protein
LVFIRNNTMAATSCCQGCHRTRKQLRQSVSVSSRAINGVSHQNRIPWCLCFGLRRKSWYRVRNVQEQPQTQRVWYCAARYAYKKRSRKNLNLRKYGPASAQNARFFGHRRTSGMCGQSTTWAAQKLGTVQALCMYAMKAAPHANRCGFWPESAPHMCANGPTSGAWRDMTDTVGTDESTVHGAPSMCT